LRSVAASDDRRRGAAVPSASAARSGSSFDFKARNAQAVIDVTMKKLDKLGKGIILMHDFHKHTAEALPELLKRLKAGGYKVVAMRSKASVQTLPQYDEEHLKDAKLPIVSSRPVSSVVQTISE
jgi:hypothetical protein